MRTIVYAIFDSTAEKRTFVGCSYTKAKEKLAEMQTANPNAELEIVYKWKCILAFPLFLCLRQRAKFSRSKVLNK